MVAESVALGMITNAIYDIAKYVIGVIGNKKTPKKDDKVKIEIRKNISLKIPYKCKELQDAGILNVFFSSPQFFDTINSFLIYKIIGQQKDKILEIQKDKKNKNQNKAITTDDLCDFLTKSVLRIYKESDVLSVPDVQMINKFFKFIIECSEETIFNSMDINDKEVIYFVNSHFDTAFEGLDRILIRISQNIDRLLKSNIVKTEANYEKIKKEYYGILKTKNSEAHIYLLDKFDFSKFYVPPILSKNPPIQSGLSFAYMGEHHIPTRFYKDMENAWKNIFAQRNIIYIVGGAGYGKSLFMKKIINDYSKLNIFHSEEYLVIYGELKMFFPNNSETPISVKEFLQNSMITSTLMDEKTITYDFVEHYLDMGRCIILLDALDEVDKTKRNMLHETIISFFKNQNPNNKICITSRNRGFIPEKDIEVFNICPLDDTQIETYVDKIIKLGKFEKADKPLFMKQTAVLVEKGFLNSFLVLSLLINIYKSERELPENKLELYQKCFEYIANKREKDKTQSRYNWEVISPMMKDNTFMELADMCYPNNTDVDKSIIKENLIKIYTSKYGNEVDTENAIEEFLKFCSDRTELFVPASGEDKFKFFHRSFFEYFYSQYIFYRCNDVEEVLKKLLQFDVDSEVFELTVAMLKQKAEDKYQALVELMISRAREEFEIDDSNYSVFNVLVLSMQVVDDILYRKQFIEILLNNKSKIINHREKMHNMYIITDIYSVDEQSRKKICETYHDEALAGLVFRFISITDAWYNISNSTETEHYEIIPSSGTPLRRRMTITAKSNWRDFYVNIFVKTVNIFDTLGNLDLSELKGIFKNMYGRKAASYIKSTKQCLEYYNSISTDDQKKICERLAKL